MNIIKRIIDTYNKGLKYDSLVLDYALISSSNDAMSFSLNDLEREYASLKSKYDLLSKQYKEFLNKGTLNILDLKSWYESKYVNKIWRYDFDGQGKKDAKLALIVTKDGEQAIKDLSLKILKQYNPEDPTSIVESVLKYFSLSKNWKYILDKDQFNKKEYWELAEISAVTRKGDCDDLAILMHNLIYYMFEEQGLSEHYWRLKLVAGTLVGYGGHAYNIWLHDDGEWYAVESTYDLRGSFSRTWLKTAIKNNNLYRSFWGFVRKDKSWVGSMSALEPYKKGEE